MHDLISVVVPIYNTELYLDRCINSIVNQTYKNLEIILVDDGSPDKCPDICDEWAKRDSRIKVIHKKNQGQGIARNIGIENATGDYICFFDSDDYVSNELVSSCVEEINKNHPDVVTYGFYCIDNKNKIETITPKPPKFFYSGKEILDFVLPNFIGKDLQSGINYNFIMSASASIFSLNMIKDGRFKFVSEKEIISEDVFSLFELFSYVKTISVIPKSFYYYCSNESSFTHTFCNDKYIRIKEFYTNILSLSDNLGYSKKIKKQLMQPFINFTIGAIKQIVKNCDKKESNKLLNEILNDDLFSSAVKTYNIKHESFIRKILFTTFRLKSVFMLKFLVKLKGEN